MQTIGAFQAKTHFSALLEQVERGEQIIITKHGHPVAKLVPATKIDRESRKEAINHLKEFNKQHTLDGLNWKTLRDEGRR
jgi:prevent-host-death family protein